jgi:hypothetical protein
MRQALITAFLFLAIGIGTLFGHASTSPGVNVIPIGQERDLDISAVPAQVYKLSDGGRLATESWRFFLVLTDKQGRAAPRLIESKTELIASGAVVETTTLPESTISRMRQRTFTVHPAAPVHSITRAYARHEVFDIPYYFPQVLSALNVDRVRVRWRFVFPYKTETTLVKEVPIVAYEQKTKLIFPISGPAIVTQGMWNNGGHSGYGNQFALDVNGLTANYGAMIRDSEDLSAYATWGREVIAPADGQVVYVRNVVPDNPPGAVPESVF